MLFATLNGAEMKKNAKKALFKSEEIEKLIDL